MAKGVAQSWWWALVVVGLVGCGTGSEGLPESMELGSDPLSGRKGKPGYDKDKDKDKGHGQDKVVVCHIPPGNPANAHTIEIGAPAVQAHLGHGDTLGACPPPRDDHDDGYDPDDCECRDDHGHHHPGDCDGDDGKPDDDDGHHDDDDGHHDDDDDDGHHDDDDDGKPDHGDKPGKDNKDKDNKGKVVVCHIPPGNPANAHTIVIGAPAVAAHLRHGDRLGACKKDYDPHGGY